VARHPSESDAYLVARVLAYALEFTKGIAFSRGGVSDPDEPAIAVRDLTGATRVWIELGMPDPGRLHKACKASPRVAVYTHKDPAKLIDRLTGERIHRAEALEVYALDRGLVAALADRLERRMGFAMSVSDREIFVSIGTETLVGKVVQHSVL
jgi:uncharacterized protein YaeQ